MSSFVSESPGLARARRVIQQAADGGTALRAILFYGSPGAGQFESAEALCRAWLGRTEAEKTSLDLSRCVDFQAIHPWGASQTIKLGAVHDHRTNDFEGIPLVDFFRARPLMFPVKVAWMHGAERINPDASNGLLRMLEELPDYARVVMHCNDLGAVLPTVRSRCTLVACSAAPEARDDHDEQAFLRDCALTAGDEARFTAHPSYAKVYETWVEHLHAPVGSALRLADRLRALADALANEADLKTRTAQMEVLELSARALARLRPENPGLAQAVVKAHRQIGGYVNASLVFDQLAAEVLRGTRR